MKTFDGKVTVVTGSSRGIGAGIARAFAEHGARVVLNGRDATALASVRESIVRAGGQAISVVADVTRAADIERIREETERALGPIDILILNAGGNPTMPGPLEETSEEGWRASIDLNLTAPFLLLKSVLPGMKARRTGNIITISTAAARRAHPRSPIPYAAAKAGLQMLTQHLATQVGPFGIRVNCIAPETIITERTGALIPEDLKQSLIESHPIRRLGTPDDVARVALFLASDDAAWITGQIIDVAGGAVMAA
ncbi:MAG TPA: SDR family NAD(P)-dependent oxidoreductase [Gemmatimonadaceae bacterium]|nr:SDR family NAD(P)-dependent oxidoreductase [Gemmatimonadaceae bacterium]